MLPAARFLLPFLWLLPGVVAPAAALGQDSVAASLVIRGATLIDGSGAGPLPDATIVVAGERIACAGPAEACPVPAGARVVDGSGMWVIPGLIDTHVHLRFATDSLWAATALRLALANGITAVREVSTFGQLEANLAIAATSESAAAPLPRMQVAGRVGRANLERFEATDMAALARRLLGMGADAIKIKGRLTLPELLMVLREIGDEAPVYGHLVDVAPRPAELRQALRAGVDGISHVSSLGRLFRDEPPSPPATDEEFLALRLETRTVWRNMDDEVAGRIIDEMVADGAWLEPTLIGDATFADPEAYLDAEVRRYLPARYSTLPVDRRALTERETRALDAGRRRITEFLARFHEAGGVVIAGSDNRYVPGFALHEELRLLSEAGLGSMGALRSATADAAAAMRREDIGLVRRGYLADLVLLDADPIADIRGTGSIRFVFKGGMRYEPARLLSGAEGIVGELRAASARGDGRGRKRRAAEFGAALLVLILAAVIIRRGRSGRRSRSA